MKCLSSELSSNNVRRTSCSSPQLGSVSKFTSPVQYRAVSCFVPSSVTSGEISVEPDDILDQKGQSPPGFYHVYNRRTGNTGYVPISALKLKVDTWKRTDSERDLEVNSKTLTSNKPVLDNDQGTTAASHFISDVYFLTPILCKHFLSQLQSSY